MNKPYPGYPPNYNDLSKVGGYARTCIVIELLTLEELSDTERAVIMEHLEQAVESLKKKTSMIESTDVVHSDRFDTQLREGLRIK